MNFQICLCGAAPGYPHAADCPRPSYRGSGSDDQAWEREREALRIWQNNGIQFPRLIAEMEARGVFALPGVLAGLSEEMDLTVDEICGLISRAQSEWDARKAAL